MEDIKNSLAYTMIPSEYEDIYALVEAALDAREAAVWEEAATKLRLHEELPATPEGAVLVPIKTIEWFRQRTRSGRGDGMKKRRISDAELVKHLPMFPAKAGGKKLTREELDKLVTHIKRHLESSP